MHIPADWSGPGGICDRDSRFQVSLRSKYEVIVNQHFTFHILFSLDRARRPYYPPQYGLNSPLGPPTAPFRHISSSVLESSATPDANGESVLEAELFMRGVEYGVGDFSHDCAGVSTFCLFLGGGVRMSSNAGARVRGRCAVRDVATAGEELLAY